MSEQTPERVVISNQPVADFSHLTSPAELAPIGRIENVAVVIVPESLAAAYAAIPSANVASTIYVPGGSNVRVHTGVLTAGGDGLGLADDVLIVVGMLLITSPVTNPVPKRIYVIGSALAPRGSESLLGQALASSSGGVSYYPHAEGQDVKILSGQIKLSGAMLANPAGRPEDILVAVGQVVVTGDVTTVGFRSVVISGQFAAPAASRDTIEPVAHIQGQAAWYEGDSPRVFNADATLTPEFFRALDHPVGLVVFGDLTVASGVTDTMMRERITSIIVFGDATAPPELVGVLQALTTDVFGDIRASDGPGS
jgi:hypothetical protein